MGTKNKQVYNLRTENDEERALLREKLRSLVEKGSEDTQKTPIEAPRLNDHT